MPAHSLAKLERTLQCFMAALCALSTLLLGMGSHNVTLPVLALVVAVSSVYFTDIKGWIRLTPWLGNLAAIVALIIAVSELSVLEREDRLLAMANLMVYLQFVLMYKEKNVHTYWLLVVASLLQVAVAAALNLSMWFGVLLVVYMFLALTTMGMFYLLREHVLHGTIADESPEPSPSGGWWPWQRRPPALVLGHAMPSADDRAFRREFVRQVSMIGGLTLVLAVFCFLVMPRFGQQQWRPANMPATRSVVGYSDEVTLGEVGEIAEDPTVVMQLWLTHGDSGAIYRLSEPPMLRGTSLSLYRNGVWARGSAPQPISGFSPLPHEQLKGLVRQRVSIEPLDNQTLFCIAPPVEDLTPGHRPDSRLQHNFLTGHMTRPKNRQSTRMQYELLTAGLHNHFHVRILPCMVEARFDPDLLQLPEPTAAADPLAGLRSIAEQVVEDIPVDDRLARARQLENYLRNSGLFSYSLDQIPRNNGDPIDDFVVRNRQGHCEYFASALTLMLRSVGIPARMVLGFRGGTWNPVGEYYQIEQLNAHTWVEAHLEARHLPDVLVMPPAYERLSRGYTRTRRRGGEAVEVEVPGLGGWLQLDPTPAAAEAEDEVVGYGLAAFGHVYDYMQFLWTNYMLGMDAQRQQETVYGPLASSMSELSRNIMRPDFWRDTWENFKYWLNPRHWNLARPQFSWQAGLITFALLWVLVGLYRLAQWIAPGLKAWLGRRREMGGQHAAARVEFYERMEALLARHALKRAPTRTQREFALEVGGMLADWPQTLGVAGVPRMLVDRFYAVRFGGRPLDNHEQQAVEQALLDLAGALERRDAAQ